MSNPQPEFNFVLLFVKDAAKSGQFYTKLLEKPIISEMDGFAMLALTDKVMLGLWNGEAAVPPVEGTSFGGGTEISMDVKSAEALDAAFKDWSEKGAEIIQEPMEMPFGRTFVAVDLDGHRLRVAHPKDM